MKRLAAALVMVLLVLAEPVEGPAITIIPKGGGEPIRGRLVRRDAAAIVLLVEGPDGTPHRTTLAADAVDLVIDPVSPERLESLSPEMPTGYRDYAEELAEKRLDPDARDLSLRLYVMAAHLAPKQLGRGALLGAAALAGNADEQRRLRALVYLLDPEHDRRVLVAPTTASPTPAAELDDQARKALLHAIRLLRSGERREAANVVRRTEVQEAFEHLRDLLTLDAFRAACDSGSAGDPIERPLLRSLLMAERRLSTRTAAEAAATSDGQWTLEAALGPALPPLKLEALVGFDPRDCIYRDGRWQRPSDVGDTEAR